MGLYDRNYSNKSFAYAGENSAQMDETIVAFVKQTYKLFAGSLLAGTIGAYIGIMFASIFTNMFVYFGLFIVEIGLIFAITKYRNVSGTNLALLFGFAFTTGLTLVPLLVSILRMPSGAGIVAQAFLLTTIIFGVMSIFAIKTTKDLANMGKMLFIALIVVVIMSVINIFLGSPILQVIVAGIGAIVFSLFIAYDTQNIIKGLYDSPVSAALALYLDFLNLFISLLQILGIFSKEE